MKKKVLLIVNHRKNRSPGQRFRFEQYLPYLESNGYQFTFSNIISEKDDRVFYIPGHYFAKAFILIKSFIIRFVNYINANDYDIIFIFREASFLGTSLFERLFAKSTAKLIFDFDDAIWLAETSSANKSLAFLKNPDKTKDIINEVDLVFAGNAYLANYAKNYCDNVKIVPTTIDTNYHIPKSKIAKDKICIGWTGTDTTIKHFEFLLPVLEKIYKQFPSVYFKLISDREVHYPSINLSSIKWSKEDEIEQLEEFDIGIMPLPDDKWSKGKCGFKGLQYMSLQIATIMSPVGVNSEIIQNGINGFLASTETEWIEKLSLLISNTELRNQLGKQARQTIIEKYSVEAWKEKYLQYFNELIQ